MGDTLNITYTIRRADSADIVELSTLLNEIIEIGGTTAFQTILTPDEFRNHFLDEKECLDCFVAQDSDESLLGFQSLRTKHGLDAGWADIATFARSHSPVKGVGRALFEFTKDWAEAQGLTHINATIRADNIAGLSYYAKIGFQDYAVQKSVPLSDGRPVDRISKVFHLVARRG